jgi:ATP-dependent DNA helicase RecG
MTPEELKQLINSGEADRLELTRAAQDTEKFREAICLFSNDMAGRGLPGYLLIGIDEKDPTHRLPVTTEMLERLVALRSDGAIMPLPVMNVSRAPHPDGGGEVIVVEVHRTICRPCVTGDAPTSASGHARTWPANPRSAF